MPEGGSSIFTDADGYQAVIQDFVDLLALKPRAFHARLTWVDLSGLQLLRAKETSERVGFMRLPANQIFTTFATEPGSTLIYNGAALEFGDLMLHGRGELLHQRTTARCEWGSVAVTPTALSEFGRTVSGRRLVAPVVGQFVRPRGTDGRRLQRLHRRICNVVERQLDHLAHREAVHALEQDLIWALISCLADGKVLADRRGSEKRPDVLAALEEMLMKEPYRLLRTREICASLGVSETTLRAKCLMALGMGPDRYQRLRRLKLLRAELLRATFSSEATVENAVIRYGFTSFNRFLTEYWRFYGEMPPIRPLDPSGK